MSIANYIQNDVLLPRLRQTGVLVVYDPAGRYRNLCAGLSAESTRVVDVSESGIESREAALRCLGELTQPSAKTTGLLIYVPAAAPVTDEDRQRDPFSIYGTCGSIFPAGDGDEFLSLCLKAKPDHATEIRRIFGDNPDPGFAVIDAVGGGLGWPSLRALLGAESARDILFALLAPTDRQTQALKTQDAWVGEARDLFKATLGLKLKTRAKAWSTIADELWRFVLFSEFVFDLPEGLPEALGGVPRAPDSARPLVVDLCERLRNDQRTRVTYIDRAESIEQELNLRALVRGRDRSGYPRHLPVRGADLLRTGGGGAEARRPGRRAQHHRTPFALGVDRKRREPGAVGIDRGRRTPGRGLRGLRAPVARSRPVPGEVGRLLPG